MGIHSYINNMARNLRAVFQSLCSVVLAVHFPFVAANVKVLETASNLYVTAIDKLLKRSRDFRHIE